MLWAVSPDAALGDADGAARHPCLVCRPGQGTAALHSNGGNQAGQFYLFFRRRVRQIFCVNRKICLTLGLLLPWFSLPARAADMVSVQIGGVTISAYRTADLDSAKNEAAAHKPIAWIASATKILSETGTIARPDGRGATFHAFYALRNRAVLVFEDAFEENHKVLPLVDAALHTPNPHYTPPKVIFLNPDATEVLATVEYEPDFQKRAHALADALAQVDAKMKAAPATPPK